MPQYTTTPEQLSELIITNRLTPLLVRYRGTTEGRFMAPAQDTSDLIAMLEKTGQYVRDISIMTYDSAKQALQPRGKATIA